MPHRRRTWTVQSCSPGGANMTATQYMLPWTHPSPHPKRHLDRFNRFCTAHGKESLYFTTGFPSPLKIAPSLGDLDPRLIHDSLGPRVQSLLPGEILLALL